MARDAEKKMLSDFSQRLKDARVAKGLSVVDFSATVEEYLIRSGGRDRFPVSTLRNYERAIVWPKIPVVVAMASVLGVKLSWLITGKDEESGEAIETTCSSDVLYEFVTNIDMMRQFKPSGEELVKLQSELHAGGVGDLLGLLGRLSEIRRRRQ